MNVAGYFSRPANGLHILNSHYASACYDLYKSSDVFEDFLKYLSGKCHLVPIQEAVSYIEKRNYDVKHPVVAFTFDDGFEECATIIAPILEKYSCYGAFFINSNYVGGSQEYINRFNEIVCSPRRSPMTWDQVRDIYKKGHVIGSHTLDHVDLSKLSSEEILSQIKKNKNIIEGIISSDCDYFAWPFGRMMHFNEMALSIVKKYHQYIFSAANYTRYYSMSGQVINRRHIEPYWPKNHIKYFLSKSKS